MTDFLYDVGTNGFILGTPLALAAGTDLSGVTSGSAVTLTGGTAGVFTQSNFGSGIEGYIVLKTVTTGWTPTTAGGGLAGWFALTPDASTYETIISTPSATVPALARPADFFIPLEAIATGVGLIRASQRIRLPEYTCKVIVQNFCGATTGAGNHTLQCCPVGIVRA